MNFILRQNVNYTCNKRPIFPYQYISKELNQRKYISILLENRRNTKEFPNVHTQNKNKPIFARRGVSTESAQLQSLTTNEYRQGVPTFNEDNDEEKTEEEIIQMKIREDKMMIYANIDEGNPNKAYDLFFELLDKLEEYNKPYEERIDQSIEEYQDKTKRKRKDKKIKPPKKKWSLRSLKIPYALIEGYLQTKNPDYFPQIFSVLSWIQGHTHKNRSFLHFIISSPQSLNINFTFKIVPKKPSTQLLLPKSSMQYWRVQ
jgi:hypothetical protein